MATALKDKLVTLEDLLAFYNEMKGKVEMWEDVTSELSAWGTRKLLDTTSYNITIDGSPVTRGGKIIFRDWEASNNKWSGLGNTQRPTAGDDTKHAYMNVSEHQIYRMISWTGYRDLDVCFFRSDGTPLLAVSHAQDGAVSGPSTVGGGRFEWNNATMTENYNTASVGLTTGTFIVPKNATRMFVHNYAARYNQPVDDFILERLIR